MSIYQRIGEAIASQGKITLVPALSQDEAVVLSNSGFKKVGTMELNGSNIDLYEVKITQVVNAPSYPYNGIRSPSDAKTFPFGQPPIKYEQQWPENYRLCTHGTSSLNADFYPLSTLDEYFKMGYAIENNKTVNIDTVQTEKNNLAKYADDSWTTFNRDYNGNRDFRNW